MSWMKEKNFVNIAYIGIDLLFPALEALGAMDCHIVEIFTCETDNVTEFNHQVIHFAQSRGIPCQVGRIAPADLRRLEASGCDLILCGGYYHRIPTDTSIPMVNLHPSLLPYGRGAWPMPHAILQGDTTSGMTLHKLSEGLDTGDIILQSPCPIQPYDNLETLTAKLQRLSAELLQQFIPQWETLYQGATPQGDGGYQPYLQETDFVITPQTSVQEADAILRAFYGYECIYHGEVQYSLLRGVAEHNIQPKEGMFPLADGFIRVENYRIL